MKILASLAAATLLAAATVTPLLAQSAHQGHSIASDAKPMDMDAMHSMMADMMPKDGDAPSTLGFKEADRVMMRDMAVAYTGDPDVDFRLKMIPHHQGAIDMAKVALAHAKDPATKATAETIIAAQEREIAEMKDWLRAHGH